MYSNAKFLVRPREFALCTYIKVKVVGIVYIKTIKTLVRSLAQTIGLIKYIYLL